MLVKHITIFGREVSRFAYLFFIVLYLALPNILFAQTIDYDDAQVIDAYNKILALKLKEGRKINNQLNPPLDKNPLRIYSDNLADILELLLSDDHALYKEKVGSEKDRLIIIEALPDSSPYKKFLEAEVKLQWAFIKLKFGDEMSAVWNLNQAYKIIKQNYSDFPQFLPNKKTLGVFHVIFGAVPQKYQWVLKFLALQGSMDTGVSYLNELADSPHTFSLEGNILLGLTETYLLGSETKSIKRLRTLKEKNSQNKLLNYLLATIFLKSNQAENALSILTDIQQFHEEYLPIIFTDYLMGEIMLQKGEYKQAIAHYNNFINNHKGQNFIKDSYYKLSIIYYLLAHVQTAKKYIEKAGNSGATVTEADKYAQKQISDKNFPEPVLLKIRYATDGGFYTQAQSLIKQYDISDFSSLKDQVEFLYRKARLFDKTDSLEQAIIYYRLTIENSGNNEWYFAPNAALQLGNIFAEKGQTEQARFYFEKAIAYKNHEYKNSISNKAEVGLKKLKY